MRKDRDSYKTKYERCHNKMTKQGDQSNLTPNFVYNITDLYSSTKIDTELHQSITSNIVTTVINSYVNLTGLQWGCGYCPVLGNGTRQV